MKLNTNSNAYIIIYSTILVIIVAFLLAFVSSSLKDRQDANVKLDQEKQVLNSLNLRDKSDSEAHALYEKIVKYDEAQKLYVCTLENGDVKYVFPLKGMGLWGGISGFIALNDDKNTVYGAYFNHESETAGLGAEIKDSREWQEKFIGKKVFDADGNVALSVVKNVEKPEHQVDCVTGATLTSNGVSDMLQKGLAEYKSFLSLQQGSDKCVMEYSVSSPGSDDFGIIRIVYPWGVEEPKDENGERLKFESNLEAIRYMYEQGWVLAEPVDCQEKWWKYKMVKQGSDEALDLDPELVKAISNMEITVVE